MFYDNFCIENKLLICYEYINDNDCIYNSYKNTWLKLLFG